jgi:VWFA-related protein
MRTVLALAALAAGLADQAVQGPSPPGLVRIDAVVSDQRGRIVDDLRAEDFQVLEDDAPQAIDSVRFVKFDGSDPPGEAVEPVRSSADERAEAAHGGTRLFAIFLDEYHVASGEGAARVREAVRRFVEQDLGPRDLVVVVKPLDSLLNLRLTRDRLSVARAIATFEGRKGQYEPRNTFEKNFIAGSPGRIEAVRTQIATSALNALATHLGSLSGARKAILFVSEGFAANPRRRGEEVALPTLQTVIRTANRATVSIYSFNPAGTAAGSGDAESKTLRDLADETDGRVVLDAPDAPANLTRIVTDESAYYMIAFRAAHPDADGKFHPVQVRIRRPGVQIRSQRGYWAASADDLLSARLLAKAVEPRPPPEPPRHVSPLIRPWFGLAHAATGNVQVSFVWEPAGRVPGDRSRADPPARITLTASKPDGTQVFEGVVRSVGYGADEPGDAPARVVFETAPGRLRLRMSIEDAASQVVDTDVRDLIVAPLTAPVVLGTAEVIRLRNARDFRTVEASADAVPVAAREFSRSERLLIRLPVYATAGSPVVSARLVSKLGSAMRDLAVAPGPAPGLYQIDLPLAGLASGGYTVEFIATSPAGEAKDSLAFRVTP